LSRSFEVCIFWRFATAKSGYLGESSIIEAIFIAINCHALRSDIGPRHSCNEISNHIPPIYTDHKLHDVGTGDYKKEKNSHGRGTAFDTPSLRSIWLTAPYFHDGSANNLEEVFQTGLVHNISDEIEIPELQALISFMMSLPDDDKP